MTADFIQAEDCYSIECPFCGCTHEPKQTDEKDVDLWVCSQCGWIGALLTFCVEPSYEDTVELACASSQRRRGKHRKARA